MRRNLTVKNEIFKAIDIRRQMQGMSLEDLANALGINRTTYRKYEDKGDMPASMLISICKVLNCTADSLLFPLSA